MIRSPKSSDYVLKRRLCNDQYSVEVSTKKSDAALQFPERDHRPMTVSQLLRLSVAKETVKSKLEPESLN
jgi:hypothetical protein